MHTKTSKPTTETKKDLMWLKELTMLDLSEDEKEEQKWAQELVRMLELAQAYQGLSTEDAEDGSCLFLRENVLRADEAKQEWDRASLLACAAQSKDGYYCIAVETEENETTEEPAFSLTDKREED